MKHFRQFRVLVPAAVKRAAALGLSLRTLWGRGGTAVGIRTARRLVRSRWLPGDFVRHISHYFPRHAGDNLGQRNPPSNGYIAWLLWGGDSGWTWARGAVRQMESA